jgi:hypothetical protein
MAALSIGALFRVILFESVEPIWIRDSGRHVAQLLQHRKRYLLEPRCHFLGIGDIQQPGESKSAEAEEFSGARQRADTQPALRPAPSQLALRALLARSISPCSLLTRAPRVRSSFNSAASLVLRACSSRSASETFDIYGQKPDVFRARSAAALGRKICRRT